MNLSFTCHIQHKGREMPQDLPEFDLDRFLPYRMTVAATLMSNDLARQYKLKYGISIAQWRVILNVGYSGTASVRDIEKRVSLEKSKVSRAASALEAEGYISKETAQHDRRLVKLELTAKGRALLAELIPLAQAYQDRLDALLGTKGEDLHAMLDTILSPDTTAQT